VGVVMAAPKHFREMYATVIAKNIRQQIEKRDAEG
jgi:hypothetical protein